MTSQTHDRRDAESLERENQTLRQRVSELQRRVARYSNEASAQRFAGLEASVSEREELLIETERIAHIGSWIWNLENNEVFWTDELFRILGYDPDVDVASTEAFFATVHPDDVERVQDRSANGIATGVAEQVDYRVQRPDGSIRHVTMNGSFLFDEQGTLRRAVGTVLDLTEIHKLHERLAHAEKLEAVGRLAAGIAHDFNNLLMIVRGNLDLMGSEDRPEMRAVLDALESARSLTSALLVFGRKSQLERRVIDLNALVGTTLQLLRRVIGEQFTLRSVLLPGSLWVDVDSALFQQLLVNLAINARDALSDGGSITVRTQRVVESEQAYAELIVEDDGSGISEADKERLFEPFFTTKLAGKGTGLGLAMVYGTVEQHGGRIEVDSALGKGSRFTVRIAACDAPNDAETIARELPSAGGAAGKVTVLIVEDQAPVAALLSKMLVRNGYRVLVAQHPRTALEIFARQKAEISLVLCDLVMPEMHGVELAAELKRMSPSLRLVFMSGYSADSAALPVGAIRLSKPFTMTLLIASVEQALASDPV